MRLRALLRTQPRRALLQSAQALPRYRHTLRQTRQKFSCRCAASCDYNLAQLKTGPSPLAQQAVVVGLLVADPVIRKLVSPEALSDFLAVGWPVTVVPDPPRLLE